MNGLNFGGVWWLMVLAVVGLAFVLCSGMWCVVGEGWKGGMCGF